MLPSEDQDTEHDIYLLFYEDEYQKVREQFREKQRSENLLKQLSLNRDNYQVISPGHSRLSFFPDFTAQLSQFKPCILKLSKFLHRLIMAIKPTVQKKTPVTETGE